MNVLEGIEARLKAATPGPWRYIDGCILSTDGTIVAQTWSKSEEDFPNHEQNGELMAAAPADLAALLAAVRAAVRWSIAECNWHTLAEDDPEDRYCEIDAALAATRGIAPAPAATSEPLHPEAYCHRCGGPNWNWQAGTHLWNIVMRPRGEVSEQWGIVCPNCFILLAESTGMASSWRLEATDVAEPLTPDPLDVCECGFTRMQHPVPGFLGGLGCTEFTPKRGEGQG